MFAGQMLHVSTETKQALGRLIARAAASGNPDAYLLERLRWLELEEERREEPASVPKQVRVTMLDPDGTPYASARARSQRRGK